MRIEIERTNETTEYKAKAGSLAKLRDAVAKRVDEDKITGMRRDGDWMIIIVTA